MPRPRVLSFMSQWGGLFPRSPSSSTPSSPSLGPKSESPPQNASQERTDFSVPSSPNPPSAGDTPRRRHSRHTSMVQTYQPPVIETAEDTLPELAPIFSFLNSHSNKLYQEGYFLKLHDLDARGRPSSDRAWTECFAQLVGTVLSLWDAAHLDAAGEDGEVIPTFINLTDASIKMIESLPMNSGDDQSLQNVLSISTAANNRYLLHFNSLHSLTQWTAGIRLAIFEQSSLQEAYTGSIIAGKGKRLNSIRTIMERARYPTEDWVRVRFGAGTPWRRCWAIVTPPDEKQITKVEKVVKKKSAYQKAPVVKGDIKFYETHKITKKTKPMATIKDAYSAYAIYPQSKALIDQSTLMKVEGKIVIHSNPETTTEGFVFLMPEVHPAVSGFELLLRFLLPIFDAFSLYGRPTRLIADVVDTRSLMFAMPSNRRYGYLDLIDVSGLIHTEGSQSWSEYEWRKQMKQLTAKRMSGPGQSDRAASGNRGTGRHVPNASQQGRPSFTGSPRGHAVRYSDEAAGSQPGSRDGSRPASRPGSSSRPDWRNDASAGPGRMYSAPQSRNISNTSLPTPPKNHSPQHQRASSDAYRPNTSSRLSFETPNNDAPPRPPQHQPPPKPPQFESLANPGSEYGPPPPMHRSYSPKPPPHMPTNPDFNNNPYSSSASTGFPPQPPQHVGATGPQWYPPEQSHHLGRDEFPPVNGYEDNWAAHEQVSTQDPFQSPAYTSESPNQAPSPRPFATQNRPYNPVVAPPSFAHKSNAQPRFRPNPNQMPEMRRANSAMDAATLQQFAEANPAGRQGERGSPLPPRARDDSQLYSGPREYRNGPILQPGPPLPMRGPPPVSSQMLSMPDRNMVGRKLSTIPGTPAVELDMNGELPDQAGPDTTLDKSSSSVYRKPVPGQPHNSSRSPQRGSPHRGSPHRERQPESWSG